jgi:hypothetical protein
MTNEKCVAATTAWNFPVGRDEIWMALLFFEEIQAPAPFLLRHFLPKPISTHGCKTVVGGEVRCRYANGYLVKRVTQIDTPRNYAFEIVEQNLRLRGIRLIGGEYTLAQNLKNQTRVYLTTRYATTNRPRWPCEWFEMLMCHAFHRYILGAIMAGLLQRRGARVAR